MPSPEQPKPKQEYNLADFYFELDKLQKEKQGLEDEYLNYINLKDLDDSDARLYGMFKQQIKNLDTLESSQLGIRTRSTLDLGLKSNTPNFKDIIRERKMEVAREGNLSQKLFCDYVAREYDKMWGLDKKSETEESKRPTEEGPTEL